MPAPPVVTRVEVGTTYIPAPRVVYIGGYRQWQPDYHRHDRRSHRDERDGEKWIRH